jgi:hypothetical protein
VSEETSSVSVAMGGLLHRGATPEQVRDLLTGDIHASFTVGPDAGPAATS